MTVLVSAVWAVARIVVSFLIKLYGPAIHEAWPIMPGVVYCTFDAFRVTLSSILRILAVNEAVLDKLILIRVSHAQVWD